MIVFFVTGIIEQVTHAGQRLQHREWDRSVERFQTLLRIGSSEDQVDLIQRFLEVLTLRTLTDCIRDVPK